MPLGRYRRARFETVRPAAVWRGLFGPAMRDRDAVNRRYCAGENSRLIVSSCPSPSPMQGYRNWRIGIGQSLQPACAIQRPIMGERSSRSLYLRPCYKGAGDIVVTGDGTRQVVSRWIDDRFRRQRVRPGVIGKWSTQSHAIRRPDARVSISRARKALCPR